MDPTIATIATNLPNLIIAVWVILHYQQMIKTLLETQQSLLEQLMALHPPQDEQKESEVNAG